MPKATKSNTSKSKAPKTKKPIKKPAKTITKKVIKRNKMQSSAKRVPITFITGNKKKLEEFLQIMTGPLAQTFDIRNKALDLIEIQGDPISIAKHKVKEAAKHSDTPVMTEDVSLCFNAFNGLPGPYM